MYTPIAFNGFGSGLNLRAKVDAVSESDAIDALNVEFTDEGAVKQRAGYDDLTTTALTNAAASLFPYYTTGGTKHLLAGCGTRLEAVNTSGAVVDSETGQTDGTWDFAFFGTPGSELAYAGQGDDLLVSWNGTAWTDVANTPAAGALAVLNRSNRMVAGRFNTTTGGPTGGAATSSPSHVYFSDAGSATAWTATNFIQVAPGDGEKVTAIVDWNEQVFIFKETKFFVVTGESTDAAGDPVFDFYPVLTGKGCVSPRAVATDETGVYFMFRDGVYRTTGNAPEKISRAIDPIFIGGSSDYFMGGELLHSQITNCAMGAHDNRIYLAYTSTGTANDYTFVYDTLADWWSLYDFDATSFASFRISSQPELVFGDSSGSKEIMRHSSAYTNDNGTAITARWRSGWFDYGQPEIKTIRESKVWGTGDCFISVARDFEQGVGNQSALDMNDPSVDTWGGTTWGGGTWAEPRPLLPELRRYAIRGTVFSTTFQNQTADATFAIHRLQHHLRESRVPSIVGE